MHNLHHQGTNQFYFASSFYKADKCLYSADVKLY